MVDWYYRNMHWKFFDTTVLEVLEEINTNDKSSEKKYIPFPEHSFLAMAFKLGLTLKDLEYFTYIDILKISISSREDLKKKRKATQADIDLFLS